MLTRAARRRQTHQLSRHFFAPHDRIPSRCISSSLSQRPQHLSRLLKSNDVRVPSRNLALAADNAGQSIPDYIPFDRQPTTSSHLWKRDVTDVVKLEHQSALHDPWLRVERLSGFNGSVDDQMTHLFACLHVGRLDRAAKLVRSLAYSFYPDSHEVIEAHEQYLTGELEALMASPSSNKLARIQRWFELDIKAKNVPVTGHMFAIMIKGALVTLDGPRKDRTVRRYLQQCRDASLDVEQEALSSSLFTNTEWTYMLRLEPDFYRELQDELTETVDPPELEQVQKQEAATMTPGGYVNSQPEFVPDVPELEAVEQKGNSLAALRRSLSSLLSSTKATTEDTTSSMADARQERLEVDVLESALEKWRSESELQQELRARGRLTNPSLGGFVYQWSQRMQAELEKEMDKADEAAGAARYLKDAGTYVPSSLLRMVPTDKLCAATILATINTIVTGRRPLGTRDAESIPISKVVRAIGMMVSEEIRAQSAKTKMLAEISELPSDRRKQALSKLSRSLKKTDGRFLKYSLTDRSKSDLSLAVASDVGTALLSILMRVAKLPREHVNPMTKEKITNMEHVFTHEVAWKKGKKIGVCNINHLLLTRLKSEPILAYLAKHLPMVIPPKPWTAIDKGAYLKTPTKAIRLKDASQAQLRYLRLAESRGDLKDVFAGLDVIGKVPWRVNATLFKTMAEIWNTGEAIGGFAPLHPPENFPPEPDFKQDPMGHRRWKTIMTERRNELTGLHSQRCYQNFQLEVARSYLNETFYCPHSFDFRGRAYPIPPYFNHMGADYVRSLFLFADGKPLGVNGLRWLKIHLANVFGYDKESLDDRESFAMDHVAEIYDSVQNPLTGKRWWLQAGDPWQCLAACIELKNALDSPVPTEYVSHLPIQQDGSCNGLQHYAALGGDEIGAQQVNLAPGSRPADIYSGVASIVKRYVKQDASNGHALAQILDGKITRKVVKQPVMTNVYGVTFHGASHQVRRQLADILPKATLDNDIHLGKLSTYVAGLIFRALGEMFNGAHAIQLWLNQCGSLICSSITPEQIERLNDERNGIVDASNMRRPLRKAYKSRAEQENYQFKSTIVWTTPLGLPVVQPYRQPRIQLIQTALQKLSVYIPSLSSPVSKRRQLQAFPPNFIHSLDATHMMLSALKCDEIGMTFSSVHDSFWTHACDVDVMSRLLRDAFVRMHSEDIIGRLREEFLARYKGCYTWTAIRADSDVGRKIFKHLKEKRHTKYHQTAVMQSSIQAKSLLEEVDRQRLLNSANPEEIEIGRAMVTPLSILEEVPNYRSLIVGYSPPMPSPNPGSTELAESTEEYADEQDDDVVMSTEPSAGDEAASVKKSSSKVYVWMPIEFPEPPQKGTFDVSRLRDSQYFFS